MKKQTFGQDPTTYSRSEQKIVLVDMDGVLANYDREFDKRWRAKHSDLYFTPHGKRTQFYHQDEHPEHTELVYEILADPTYFYDLEPIRGAVEGIANLAQHYDVRICTSPALHNNQCMPGKYDWVERHLGPEWVKKIIVTKTKTMINGDYLIDDRPEIRGDETPSWKHILYDQPYNQGIDKPRMTWSEINKYGGNLEKMLHTKKIADRTVKFRGQIREQLNTCS